MSTVLVTGGAGFVGSHLCERLLAEGKRVIAVDDLSTGRVANIAEARAYGAQFTFYSVDVCAEGMSTILGRHRPDLVYHLAARPEARSVLDPRQDAHASVAGLLNLLEAAAAAGVGKVVLASCASVYGQARKFPVRETMLAGARPKTPGAIGKRLAEEYLRFYERFRGVDFTVLVLATVYGPRRDPAGDPGLVGSAAVRMLAGERPIVRGDGHQTRDFVFVDDVVHALALAADRGSGRVLNVGGGVETSVNALCHMLGEIIGFRGEPLPGPPEAGDVRRMVLDIEQAGLEIGWRPWTHLEDGLAETVASIREQL